MANGINSQSKDYGTIIRITLFIGVPIIWLLGIFLIQKYDNGIGGPAEAVGALFSGLAFVGLVIEIMRSSDVLKQQVVATQDQLVATQEQVKIAKLTRISVLAEIVPYVLVGLIPYDPAVIKPIDQIRVISPPYRKGRTIKPSVDSKLYFQVENKTTHIASHLLCIYYRSGLGGRFLTSDLIEVLEGQSKIYLPIKHDLTEGDLEQKIGDIYEGRGKWFSEKVKDWGASSESMIIPLFFDVSGTLYSTPRIIFIESTPTGEVYTYSKSDLFYDETYDLPYFAPPFESMAKIFGVKHSPTP